MPIKIDRIIRTNRQTISLVVNAEGEVVVRAPKKAADEYINYFVEKKSGWIMKKQTMMQERKLRHLPKTLQDGESLLYLGENLRLIHWEGTRKTIRADGCLLLSCTKDNMKQAIIDWYSDEARVIFKKRLDLYSELMGLQYKTLRISGATRRWGSCSDRGSINLNWRLMMCPLPVIDYVVVHELAHLKYLNHSKDFWQLVQSIIPDSNTYRKWLKDNGRLLTVI
jgi:predicted metal-dependent hydrolase